MKLIITIGLDKDDVNIIKKIYKEQFIINSINYSEESLESIINDNPWLTIINALDINQSIEFLKKIKDKTKVGMLTILPIIKDESSKQLNKFMEVGIIDYIPYPLVIEQVTLKISLHYQYQNSIRMLHKSESMASLGNMVAAFTHEINTPIGNSLSAATELQNNTTDIYEEFQTGKLGKKKLTQYFNIATKACKIIEDNLVRAAGMVGGFKNVSAKQSSERLQEFELISLLEDIILTMDPSINKTKISINLSSPKKVFVNSFPGAISHIFINLINNSLLHAYPEKKSGNIAILVEENNDLIHLIYKDDGLGMTEEVRNKIFNPYFTTKLHSGGSGIGLHVVLTNVTEILNGSIDCKSKLNEGSEFLIKIPKRVRKNE